VDPSTLPPAVVAWWFEELLPWGRANALRLKQGQTWCLKQETKPPDPG
jgi:hypothetical protein